MGCSTEKIAEARITATPRGILDPMPEVWVRFDGERQQEKLFSFYPDEVSFFAEEFIGLTRKEAIDLFRRRDLAYLQ